MNLVRFGNLQVIFVLYFIDEPQYFYYRCDVCQIVTTDQGGLDAHLQGKKHKKKLNALKWASA